MHLNPQNHKNSPIFTFYYGLFLLPFLIKKKTPATYTKIYVCFSLRRNFGVPNNSSNLAYIRIALWIRILTTANDTLTCIHTTRMLVEKTGHTDFIRGSLFANTIHTYIHHRFCYCSHRSRFLHFFFYLIFFFYCPLFK